MSRETTVNAITFMCVVSAGALIGWAALSAAKLVLAEPAAVVEPAAPAEVAISVKPPPAPVPAVERFTTVEKYFSAGNPNPLTHRFGEPPTRRDVSSKQRNRIIARDGGCCLVCRSTSSLECDHRIALMNGGGNGDENLGTLCDECHKEKTRYDWSIQRRRRKMLKKAAK